MKRKIVHKKKIRRWPLKKHLILIFSLTLALLGIIFLPDKQPSGKYCANSLSCTNDISGAYDDNNLGEYEGKKIAGPALSGEPYKKIALENNVLGDTTASNKHIYINLSTQTLTAFDGNTKVFEFPVSTGKWSATPTGDFNIWIKLRYTRMTGGDKSIGTYYNLPNVPYTMYFYNKEYPKNVGYGIHGAYWHNNFGHPMSHGCVNMREEEVARLYYWANPPSTTNVTYATAELPGTPITIFGTTPIE